MQDSVTFQRGRRQYFVVYEVSLTGKLTYGACVYKSNSGQKPSLSAEEVKEHFNTARARFSRFPVETEWSGFPDSWKTGRRGLSVTIIARGRTRNQKRCFLFFSKEFKNILVKKMCQFGVRHRGSFPNSLKEKEFILNLRLNDKQHNRLVNDYFKNRIKDEDQDTYLVRKRALKILEHSPKLSPSIPIHELLIEDSGNSGRIIHVVYRRDCQTSALEYGASIFHPTCQEDIMAYDEDRHFETACERFDRFPVKGVYFDFPTHRYPTSEKNSGLIPYRNRKIIMNFRKLIAKYGVRIRSNPQSQLFLKTSEKLGKCCSETKKLGRKFSQLNQEFSAWKKRTPIELC